LEESVFYEADAVEMLEAKKSLWGKPLPPPSAQPAPDKLEKAEKLKSTAFQLDESFSSALLRIIDAKGKTDAEVYKRANIDRKLFSKIRTGKGYMPSKKTAVALAVSLELPLDEARDLLTRAGFALSRSVVFDVIIEYFITREKFDIYEINNVLFEYDQPLLGN
jgi:transcriptional regulator with XRE-family HTH domain